MSKPRKRLEQKQSARMYLRSRDHRDVIYQDKYHNAIYVKKDDTDEISWVKYPRDALIRFIRTNYSANAYLGWIDTERQFQYGQYIGNASTNLVLQIDKYNCCVYYIDRENTCLVTTDGIVWKTIQGKPVYWGNTYFANDSVWNPNGTEIITSGTYSFTISELNYNEDTDVWSWRNITINVVGASGSRYSYLGATNEGGIFMEYSRTEPSYGADYITDATFVKILKDGTRHVISHEFLTWEDSFIMAEYGNGYSVCRAGSKMGCVQYYRRNKNRNGEWYERLDVGISPDFGNTWNFERLLLLSDSSTRLEKYAMFARGNTIYLLYNTNGVNADQRGDMVMKKTTDGMTWEEITLPSVVELPVISYGGYGIADTSSSILRIAIKPTQVESYDVSLASLMFYHNEGVAIAMDFYDKHAYSIHFKDGEICDADDEDFYLCLYIQNGWCAYFNNEHLTATEGSFAWYANDTISGVPDILTEGDYCYRGSQPYEYWSPYKNYKVGDIVLYNDTWICIAPNTNQVPKADSIYWRKQE